MKDEKNTLKESGIIKGQNRKRLGEGQKRLRVAISTSWLPSSSLTRTHQCLFLLPGPGSPPPLVWRKKLSVVTGG
jgi:hypothetical protein